MGREGDCSTRVVGQLDDLSVLKECGTRLGGTAAENAGTAMFEIRHRVAPG
jgi:hypothetical protein